MKKSKKKSFISGGMLTIALMGANVLNFIFNAFVGRTVPFEAFGLITLLSTFFYIGIIFYNSLSATVNHHVAYLEGIGKKEQSEKFTQYIANRTFYISLLIALIWMICTPFIAAYFNITNVLSVYLFSIIIIFYPFVALGKGYFQGKFLFLPTAVLTLIEPLIKLVSAVGFVFSRFTGFTYTSIYISSGVTTLLTFLFYKKRFIAVTRSPLQYTFSKQFFFGAVLTGLSTLSFLALDVILVKHFLSPVAAGQYALLSLTGKIIFFLGSLLNMFTISIVSKGEGEKKNPLIPFYTLLLGSLLLMGIGYLFLGVFGSVFAHLLFGTKILAVVSYLPMYSISILLFTLGNVVVTYHLAKKQYFFSIFACIMAVLMIIGIYLFHQNIQQVVQLIFVISILNTIFLFFFHMQEAKPLRFISRKKLIEMGKII